MKILELRILPPIAIGRLGASDTPMAAYNLTIDPDNPLNFRKIIPETTFTVDPKTGVLKAGKPSKIQFKDAASLDDCKGKILPVAPFLEVFAITDDDPGTLKPLTVHLLEAAGHKLGDISWDVNVGNIKIYRRTGKEGDKISAVIKDIKTYQQQDLLGQCPNFIKGKSLPLGKVQFIQPTKEFPELRFRFTPGPGKVYGSALKRYTSFKCEVDDPVIDSEDLIIYDKDKGTWRGFYDKAKKEWVGYSETAAINPIYTNPAQIFAGFNDDPGNRYSWGYLDDECDGYVTVKLKTKTGQLTANAHISAGPPAFAPDTLPIRVVSDELEQIIKGVDVDETVTLDEAEDIIRRALETIRLMNTAIMNGNNYEGKPNQASTMVRQNTNDFGRLYEPIMATSLVDNLALQVLHERVFNGLATGASPWFADLLRRPDEIGDLSAKGLRKMPALMRGADGRSLTFTHRQINMIVEAAKTALLRYNGGGDPYGSPFETENLVAQIHYRGKGNPFAVLPRTAISNCFPGLEFDFRNLWRRAFKGIVLIENNNLVVDADNQFAHLVGHRLVAIEKHPTMVSTSGPVFPDSSSQPLITTVNPNGVSFMEWSNSMVNVLQKQGEKVKCHFTAQKSDHEVVVDIKKLNDPTLYTTVELEVNHIFEGKSAVISDQVLLPGELTQGLCAPWQNDYRECACYYWAASRPDYVNVVADEKGLSTGDSWMAKKRTGKYIPDDRTDSRLHSYDDLFINWQGELNFIVEGKDALESQPPAPEPIAKK